jgi:hypothetical protein
MHLPDELVIDVPGSKSGATLFSPVHGAIVSKWIVHITDSTQTKSME